MLMNNNEFDLQENIYINNILNSTDRRTNELNSTEASAKLE